MANTNVAINRLVIRSRGVPVSTVRDAIAQLNPILLSELAKAALPGIIKTIDVGELNVGSVTVSQYQSSDQVGKAIANAITTGIVEKSTETKG